MDMVSLESAQKIVALAIEKAAKDFGRPICVSVCDKYGFLVAFGRMNNAPVRSIEISRRKAYTAVRIGVSTDAFLARLHKEQIEAGFFGDDMLTALPGGNLLKDAAGNVTRRRGRERAGGKRGPVHHGGDGGADESRQGLAGC